jgi:hypothetical protein
MMSASSPLRVRARLSCWFPWLLAIVVLVAAIAGCGGGVGVGGTGAYASGPISGFGSVIVNGIEFDDSGARIEDEDGAASSSSALRLGMLTEIDSGAVAGSGDALTAVATRVRFRSEIVGLVSAKDTAANTLNVFGQTVHVTPTTVFDEVFSGGLTGVTVGQPVEVYGFYDPAGTGGFTATRIEPRTGTLAFYKVRGPVRNLDRNARTFQIGPLMFNFTALSSDDVPAGLDNGVFVRVRVSVTPVAGQWQVLSLGLAQRSLPDLDGAKLRGLVSAFTTSSNFSVNGQPVDASAAPAVTGLALGVRVEVEGPVVAGVLRATKVQIEDSSGPQTGFRLNGLVQEPIRPAFQTFVLRGVTVYYGLGNPFDNRSAADLVKDAKVEVRGVLSADGTRLVATRIKFVN